MQIKKHIIYCQVVSSVMKKIKQDKGFEDEGGGWWVGWLLIEQYLITAL